MYFEIVKCFAPTLKEDFVMGKVISFINYKGGVGKTTTTYHIGCALADKIFKLGFANRRGYDLLGGKHDE